MAATVPQVTFRALDPEAQEVGEAGAPRASGG
jgi:hypothetical protein